MSIPHLDSIPFLLRILFPTSFSRQSQTKSMENGPRPRTGRDGMNQFAWEIEFTCVQCTCASTCTCIERRMGGTASSGLALSNVNSMVIHVWREEPGVAYWVLWASGYCVLFSDLSIPSFAYCSNR